MPVSVPPVRMTKSTPSWATRWAPSRPPEQGTNCSTFLEIPARQKHWHSSQATSTASLEGLKMTVLPAAKAATMPPQGMAMGKFHGEITAPTPLPRRARVSMS